MPPCAPYTIRRFTPNARICTRRGGCISARTRGRSRPSLIRSCPPPLILQPNKGYIRGALRMVGVTLRRGQRLPVGVLPNGADFFRYQKRMNPDVMRVPSHAVVAEHIRRTGQDFRVELAPHPVELMRNRAVDQVRVGR